MSSAHRPTWDPAAAKKQIATRIYSSRDIAAHTRLKFRQPGQQAASDVGRRDLKLELLEAERLAAQKKANGETVLGSSGVNAGLIEPSKAETAEEGEEPEAKRRRLLELAQAEEDADDVDDDDAAAAAPTADKGKGKAVAADQAQDEHEEDDDDEDDDDDDDDEDETAELLRELEKIKRERAEEKARQERERQATDALTREEEIAMANPLLNLQAALGNASPSPSMMSSSASSAGGFGVKRRWDEDVIFKNQAQKDDKPKNEFVNDLVRTEFHKRFMKRFVA